MPSWPIGLSNNIVDIIRQFAGAIACSSSRDRCLQHLDAPDLTPEKSVAAKWPFRA
jgi:hypothetical protein